jgi:hypothetical protein
MNNKGKAVAVDGANNVFISANFYGTVNFGGVNLASSSSGYNMALVKLSGTTGATTWAKRYGSSSNDMPNNLAVDPFGDVVVTGSIAGPSDLGGGLTGSAGSFAAKYSGTDGTYRWAEAMGGSAGNGITTDPITGNVFVTGQGSAGFFLNAYDASGNQLWAYANGTSGDTGLAVSVDGNGNLALTGQSNTTLNFGTGWMFGSGWFVVEFTASGNLPPVFRWAKRANSQSWGCGVGYDSVGHLLVTGNFETTAIDFGGISLTPGGYIDTFLVQYTK